MIDVKKLIAGFLILTTGAISSVLIFSSINSPRASIGSSGLAINSTSSLIGNNAFEQQSSDDIGNASTSAIVNDPNNLTVKLAGTLLNGIANANPDGPITDDNGNIIMTPPSQAKMVTELSSDAALKNFEAPNWEAQATSQKLNLVSESDSAKTAYGKAVADVINNNIIQTNLQSIVKNAATNSDTNSLDIIKLDISNALTETLQIPTPPSLLNFQKSLVKFLVYEQNALQTADDAQTDPLKASLTLKAESNNNQSAANQLKNELDKTPLISISLNNPKNSNQDNNLFGFINNILGVHKAYAIFGVGDITFEPTAIAEWIEEFAENLALQLLKNLIISIMQNKVLGWVKGAGLPKFVTSWAVSLANAFQSSALSYLNGITPQLCPQIAPSISMSLKITTQGQPSQSSPVTGIAGIGAKGNICTLNVPSGFKTNFLAGGLPAYYNTLDPNNNFYSQFFSVQDSVQQAAAAQAAATQAKSVAAQGFKGDQVCADGSNPNGSYCVDDETGESFPAIINNGTPSCAPLETLFPNGGLCTDGSEPITTTPGKTTGDVTASALGSNIELVVNANNIAGIMAAFADSLMSSLIKSALATVSTQINGALGLPGGPTAPAGSGGMLSVATTTAPAVSCGPSSTTLPAGNTFSLAAGGGTPDTSGNTPSYSWSAPGASPASMTGAVFNGSYTTAGTYNITVTASTGGAAATCQVIVTPPLLPVSCSPNSQNVAIASLLTGIASFSASGGNTNYQGTAVTPTYTWSATGANPSTGTGSTFSGSYNTAGTYNVIVTASDGSTATCQVVAQ